MGMNEAYDGNCDDDIMVRETASMRVAVASSAQDKLREGNAFAAPGNSQRGAGPRSEYVQLCTAGLHLLRLPYMVVVESEVAQLLQHGKDVICFRVESLEPFVPGDTIGLSLLVSRLHC